MSTDSRLVVSSLPLPHLPCTALVASSSACTSAGFGPTGAALKVTVGPLAFAAGAEEVDDPCCVLPPVPGLASSCSIAAATAGFGWVATTVSQSLPMIVGLAPAGSAPAGSPIAPSGPLRKPPPLFGVPPTLKKPPPLLAVLLALIIALAPGGRPLLSCWSKPLMILARCAAGMFFGKLFAKLCSMRLMTCLGSRLLGRSLVGPGLITDNLTAAAQLRVGMPDLARHILARRSLSRRSRAGMGLTRASLFRASLPRPAGSLLGSVSVVTVAPGGRVN